MLKRNFCASMIAAAVVVAPVQRAQANDAAALLGGLIIGGAIASEVAKNKQRRTQTTTYSNSAAYSAQREQNRQVQSALNYFGYNVGTVDGSIGPRSRAAISQYQAQMGFQPDGQLDPYERDFLLGSHQRAMASSHVPPYNQVMATQGPSGLLRTYRNEQLGIATNTGIQPVAPVPAPQPVPQPVVTAPMPAPAPVPQATQPVPVPTRANNATLPSFPIAQASRSMSAHCNEINVLTAANGGISTAGRISDASFALNEQFCLARTHAMADSTTIVASIPNMTDAQVQAQCEGLAQVISPQLQNLASARPDMVISEASAVLQGSGQPVEQLASGGKVCLGVGYRIDDPKMALASAVLLTAAGQMGYGEAVSHQMREGFGTARTDAGKAGEWMKLALDTLSRNPAAAVMGQSADRVAVLQSAMSATPAAAGSAALPVFPSTNN